MSILLNKKKTVDPVALTREIKAIVPSLEGITNDTDTVEFRRLSGEFDLAENSLIRGALNAHDAGALLSQAKAKKQEIEALKLQLSGDQSSWVTLTATQKIDAINRILRYIILKEVL